MRQAGEQVGKKGIVRDRKVHIQVIENVIKYSLDNGLAPVGLTFSPVTGAKGNIEFLLYIDGKTSQAAEAAISHEQIEKSSTPPTRSWNKESISKTKETDMKLSKKYRLWNFRLSESLFHTQMLPEQPAKSLWTEHRSA